ncbi:hypothetical protein [Lentisphaera araneosa]|uniref:hypothetical protein n=1 Tax=Lentisphaera araneosa TaxID=256847 RepID=UPI000594AEA6|nr:hypothetical protein [Lentisphaera araneosa]
MKQNLILCIVFLCISGFFGKNLISKKESLNTRQNSAQTTSMIITGLFTSFGLVYGYRAFTVKRNKETDNI